MVFHSKDIKKLLSRISIRRIRIRIRIRYLFLGLIPIRMRICYKIIRIRNTVIVIAFPKILSFLPIFPFFSLFIFLNKHCFSCPLPPKFIIEYIYLIKFRSMLFSTKAFIPSFTHFPHFPLFLIFSPIVVGIYFPFLPQKLRKKL